MATWTRHLIGAMTVEKEFSDAKREQRGQSTHVMCSKRRKLTTKEQLNDAGTTMFDCTRDCLRFSVARLEYVYVEAML